jgi:hypothetical protein
VGQFVAAATDVLMIRVGVYRKRDTVTPDRPRGFLHQLLLLARHQATGEECVLYIPAPGRTRVGRDRAAVRHPARGLGLEVEFIGEGLPPPSSAMSRPPFAM